MPAREEVLMTSKPLAEQSPSEIDVQLAALYEQESKALALVESAKVSIHYKAGSKKVYLSRGTSWSQSFAEAVTKVEEMLSSTQSWTVREAQQALEGLDKAKAKVAEIRAQAEVFDAEFERRGGWTRAFLAKSANGHVHNGMNCSTCNKMGQRTEFGWFPQYSGRPEAEIVEDAGERACTTCYPTAPVSVLNRPTKFFTEDEIAKAKAREEREAKRAAAAEAKVVVPDFPTRLWRSPTREFVGSEKIFKTERGAWQHAVSARADVISWGGDHPSVPEWIAEAEAVERALAAKSGRTFEEVSEEVKAKSVLTAKRRG